MNLRNSIAVLLASAVITASLIHSHAAAQTIIATTQPADGSFTAAEQNLHAGPISAKFSGGELRYLQIGDKEILRRIYFGVREAKFSATDMPHLSDVHVDAAADHFSVHFAALCSGKTVSFNWVGDITGTADGKIIFHAKGAAPSDGTSARIGLCVLLGSDLAGHAFAVTGDSTTSGTFPELVSAELVANNFHTLQYTLGRREISFTIPQSPFYMEDQRTYGDTSFKAYNPMPYAYPNIDKGKGFEQTLTVSVKDAPAPASTAPTTTIAASTSPTTWPADDAIHLRIGSPISGARVCAISSADEFKSAVTFGALNQHRDTYNKETAVTWAWTTATHLPDNDTAMENTPAIIDQAKTVRSFAPRALLRVGPISIDGKWPVTLHAPIATAAWTTSAIHSLSEANIDEAAFLNPTPESERIISLFKKVTGKPLVQVNVSRPRDVHAFAVNDIGATTLWIVNRTGDSQKLSVDNLPAGASAKMSNPLRADASRALQDVIKLSPYDVLRIVIPQ